MPAILLYAWRPQASEEAGTRALGERIAAATTRVLEVTICTHPGGPPICWCRPPLPGMWMAFAHRHGVDVQRSAMFSARTTDRTMARALGMRFVPTARVLGG